MIRFLATILIAAPLPIPAWYWSWAQWRLGNGAYKCLPYHSSATRPVNAPKSIPQWSWDKLSGQIKAGALVRPPCPDSSSLPPPATPTPIPTPIPPGEFLTAEEQQIIDTSNQERAIEGQPPLQVDMKLVQAARDKTANNAQYGLQHNYVDPNGTIVAFSVWTQRWCPNTGVGENVALGYSAAVVSNAWAHHPGHRENLLDPNWHYIGASIISANGTMWASEDFAATSCQ